MCMGVQQLLAGGVDYNMQCMSRAGCMDDDSEFDDERDQTICGYSDDRQAKLVGSTYGDRVCCELAGLCAQRSYKARVDVTES
jgi:hypothetical protein